MAEKRGKIMHINPEDTFVRILLVDHAKRILIQQRNPHKKHYPGLWEVCGGKKEMTEQWAEAASRELWEELGIKKNPDEMKVIEHTILPPEICGRPLEVRWFLAQYCGEEICCREEEVIDIRWCTAKELLQQLAKRPNEFLPGMAPFIDRFWGAIHA